MIYLHGDCVFSVVTDNASTIVASVSLGCIDGQGRLRHLTCFSEHTEGDHSGGSRELRPRTGFDFVPSSLVFL